jgi:hypothetical protein
MEMTHAQAAAVAYFKKLNQRICLIRTKEGAVSTELFGLDLRMVKEDRQFAKEFFALPMIVSIHTSAYELDCYLPELTRLKSLRHLEAERGRIGNRSLAALAKMGQLRTLRIPGSDIDDEDLAVIIRSLPHLRWLDISDCRLSGKGFRHLAQLKRLQTLVVGCQGFRSEHLKYLSQDSVEYLDLSNSGVDDRAGPFLRKFVSLRSLDLTNTDITEAIIPSLAGIRHFSYLSLRSCHVLAAALPRISALKALETLDLRGIALTPESLSALPALSRLRTLLLPECPMTQELVRTLLRCRALEQLYTQGTRCDDHGLRALASLPRLRWIDVDLPPVTLPVLSRCLTKYKSLTIRGWSGGRPKIWEWKAGKDR